MKNLFNLYSFTIEVNLIKADHVIIDTKSSDNEGIMIINELEEYDLDTNEIASFDEIEVEYKGATRYFAQLTDFEGNIFLLNESLDEVKLLIKLAIIEADWDSDIEALCDGSRNDEEEEEDTQIDQNNDEMTNVKKAA